MSDESTEQETAPTSKRACGLIVDFDFALIDGISALEKACAKVLEGAGLVTKTAAAQRRSVHLEAGAFDLMTKWIERYQQAAESRFQRLDEDYG